MAYPCIGIETAAAEYTARLQGAPPCIDTQTALYRSGADFDESRAVDFLNQCSDLALTARDADWSAAQFDNECAPLVHRTLALPPIPAGDADFWRWLTFSHGGWGADVIDRRYAGSRGKPSWSDPVGPARRVYYGLEELKKGMFAKLWICANSMYIEDASAPYDGIAYADVDLWDSHVIDVNFGSSAPMARAFVKVVRDMKLPRGEAKDPAAPAGFRDLAKEIRRRQATIVFELFDDETARRWVEELWNDRESWCGKR